MKKLWMLGLGMVFVAGIASAQVDQATRTVSASVTGVVNADGSVSQTGNGGGIITGTLHMSDLVQSEMDHIIYHFSFGPLGAGGTGLSCADLCLSAAEASVWFNGDTDDTKILTNGLEDGYGNELAANMAGGVDYTFAAFATVPLDGLAAGATGFAYSSITLLGADAVDRNGDVIGSANFSPLGYGAIGFTAPEPTPFVLLGTGLFGLIPFVKRYGRAGLAK